MQVKIMTVELKRSHLSQMEIVRLYDVRSVEALHGKIVDWNPLGLVRGKFVTDSSDQDDYVLVEGNAGTFVVPTNVAYNIWSRGKADNNEMLVERWNRSTLPHIIV